MDKDILKRLSDLEGDTSLVPLLRFMNSSRIEFRDRKLRGPYGIATYYAIYLDINKMIEHFNVRMISYVILHEIGHYKRINKIGKETIIKMLSDENFDSFCDHVIGEEIIADRYACLVYYLLNKETFPRMATQQLEIPYRKREYSSVARNLFGVIKNSEENYKNLLESFIE